MTYVVITKKEKVEKMCRVARCLKVHWLDFKKKYDVGKRPGFRLFRKSQKWVFSAQTDDLAPVGWRLMMMEKDSCFYVAFGKMWVFNAETGD